MLEEAPEFTALSYTWDAQARYRPLLIGEPPQQRRLNMTPNLEAYLRETQDREDARKVYDWRWIDAICINQGDKKEKGEQVPRMREIYGKAERIDIWLGAAKWYTHLAFTFMDNWKSLRGQEDQSKVKRNFTKTDRMFYKKERSPERIQQHEARIRRQNDDLASEMLKAIKDMARGYEELLNHDYWRRVWVFQEITTPKSDDSLTVCCGNHRAAWKYFKQIQPSNGRPDIHSKFNSILTPDEKRLFVEELALIVDDLIGAYNNNIENLSSKSSERAGDAGDADLATCETLESCKVLQASDPRDKLYALLQLTKDRGIIPANYDVSFSVESAYTNFAVAMIKDHKNLDILGCVGIQSTLNLPSWVPDWTSKNTAKYLERGDGERREYHADADIKAHPWVDDGILHTCGFSLGTIRPHERSVELDPGRHWYTFGLEGISTGDLETEAHGHGPFLAHPLEKYHAFILLGSQYPVVLMNTPPPNKHRWSFVGEAYIEGVMRGNGFLRFVRKEVAESTPAGKFSDFITCLDNKIATHSVMEPVKGKEIVGKLKELGLSLNFTEVEII
ncbi:hypothetical protein NA57DRAFT_80364 [Rhizodiscina lignyota]|uniref:Heterokaryon incompatibility domain-containing protein n=1 Tax=Rhizodiscina lignyota TaxID=1504668 RepID=A0A9P4I9P4_9PEZI|nr:hypothetical protein NA57DRAFT_80364 [Rhizodiscina lignyota]